MKYDKTLANQFARSVCVVNERYFYKRYDKYYSHFCGEILEIRIVESSGSCAVHIIKLSVPLSPSITLN